MSNDSVRTDKVKFGLQVDESSSLLSHNSTSTLTPLQSQVDALVGGFVEQATDLRSLAAMTAGGAAYRLGRMGGMTVGAGRLASLGIGLGTEVTAFEMTNRSLYSLNGNTRSNPNLWRWEGQGGIRQGLASSLVTFGTLKGAGRLAQGENVVVQHLLQDTGMVLGHQVSAAFGVTQRPTGSLAEQFLHAEATNLQLGAGMALAHSVTPGIQSLERGLDLALKFSPPDEEALPKGQGPDYIRPGDGSPFQMQPASSFAGNVFPGSMTKSHSFDDSFAHMADLQEKERVPLLLPPPGGTSTTSSEPPRGELTQEVSSFPPPARTPSPIPESFAGTLVENQPIMMLVTNTDGNIVYANAEARRVMGTDLVGKKMGDFLNTEWGPSRNLQYHLRSDIEKKVLWEDRPHPSNSNLTAHYLLDITGQLENARLQDEILRLQIKAGEGYLAQEVVHDARQPLTAALLAMQCLSVYLHDVFPDMEAESGITANEIETWRQNPLAMLRDIQDAVTKTSEILKTGMNILRGGVSDLSLEGVLTDVISQNVPLWIRNNIQWKTEIDPHIGIYGSRQGISRVLQNLLENARAALPDGGMIAIRAYTQDRNAVIEITDTGHGIPPEVLPFIFDEGFSTKGDQGNGLGLAIVKKIIDHQKGRIEVESEVGLYTMFRIILPQMKSDPPETQH